MDEGFPKGILLKQLHGIGGFFVVNRLHNREKRVQCAVDFGLRMELFADFRRVIEDNLIIVFQLVQARPGG